MKIVVDKKGLITIDPQGEDVVGIVKLLEGHYYDAEVDMQYVETEPAYYMDEGAFYCSSEKVAMYNKENKLDFVRKILNHLKVNYAEYRDAGYFECENGPSNDMEFDKDKVYLNTFECEEYTESGIELVINGDKKDYFLDYDMDNGVDGEIWRLCRDLGHGFEWKISRFPQGSVCKSCYSSDLHQFEQDGDVRGECDICGEITTLYSR